MSMTRPARKPKRPALHLLPIEMADGSDINGPAAQARIARASADLIRDHLARTTPEAAHAAD